MSLFEYLPCELFEPSDRYLLCPQEHKGESAMSNKTVWALATAFSAASVAAFGNAAEAKYWGVNARQNRQQNRIYQGISSGQLNNYEARRLENQ